MRKLGDFCRPRLNISRLDIDFDPILPTGQQIPCGYRLGKRYLSGRVGFFRGSRPNQPAVLFGGRLIL